MIIHRYKISTAGKTDLEVESLVVNGDGEGRVILVVDAY